MMKRFAVALVVVTSLVGVVSAPASAHFMHGVNCHIVRVRQNGVVVVRMTNRTNFGATLECVLKTYGNGVTPRLWSIRRIVGPRRYVIAKPFLPGNWKYVSVRHAHIYFGD